MSACELSWRAPPDSGSASGDRQPCINATAISREEIRAGVERLQGMLDFFVRTTHPGTIRLQGDSASGRAYICELIHFRDGRSELNYAVYHDRYQRTDRLVPWFRAPEPTARPCRYRGYGSPCCIS